MTLRKLIAHALRALFALSDSADKSDHLFTTLNAARRALAHGRRP